MMKILYLANIRLPTEKAHGLQIMKTCAALGSAEIELVVPSRNNHLSDDPFTYYGIKQHFKITVLQVPDLIRYGRLGFVISALWFSEKSRWLPTFWSSDYIYSRDALVLAQYALLGRKLVFEAHTKPSLLSRMVARRAHRVIVISHGLKDAYVNAGVSKDNIVVAPDAVDENLFSGIPNRSDARDTVGLPRDKAIVLYAGHLYRRKGADILAAVAAQIPDALFVFVGGTTDDVSEFKKKWQGAENVRVVGHIVHEKIPFYLRAADVLILPNSGRDEDSARFTSPMKLFEYMASGTPIVSSDLPSIREVLDDQSCFFVSPDNSDALAQGIKKVFLHTKDAIAKAERALSLVQGYTWSVRAKQIADALSVPQSEKDTRYYDTESAVYSAKRYPESPVTFTQYFFKARLKQTLALLAPYFTQKPPRFVLEIGCADGIVAHAIWKRFTPAIAAFDAVDAAPDMICVAKEQHKDTPIHFSMRDGPTLPGTYDLIIEVGVLNYTDIAIDFEAVASALAQGGRYVCSLAGDSSLQHLLKGSSGYKHLRSYADYERELGEHFKIEHREAIGFFIPLLWKIPKLARVVQPIFDWFGRHVAPSLALEQLYVLTSKRYA